MISNSELELIQSYHDKSSDVAEKEILSHILEEMKTRVPVERRIGSNCPICKTYIGSNAQFCWYCGQAIE